MKKIIIMIGIVMILLIGGCGDNTSNYNLRDWCRDNVLEINCEQLLKCDANCDKLDFNSHIRTCHSSFTNHIISKCKPE